MDQVERVAHRAPEPIEGVDDDHVALARVPDDLAQSGPVGRRPGLLVDVDPLARDPDLRERVDLSIEVLLDGCDACVPELHTVTVPEVVDVRNKRNVVVGTDLWDDRPPAMTRVKERPKRRSISKIWNAIEGGEPADERAVTVDYNVLMAAKSSPVSVRISKRLEAFVDQEARRTGRSRSAVLEALADEAVRMRLFPGIAFRGADWERRAWVIGTALDVWQIVEAYRDIGSVERMAAEGAASERQIRLALAYHERFPEEVDAAIAADRRPLEQLRDAHPFITVSDAGA